MHLLLALACAITHNSLVDQSSSSPDGGVQRVLRRVLRRHGGYLPTAGSKLKQPVGRAPRQKKPEELLKAIPKGTTEVTWSWRAWEQGSAIEENALPAALTTALNEFVRDGKYGTTYDTVKYTRSRREFWRVYLKDLSSQATILDPQNLKKGGMINAGWYMFDGRAPSYTLYMVQDVLRGESPKHVLRAESPKRSVRREKVFEVTAAAESASSSSSFGLSSSSSPTSESSTATLDAEYVAGLPAYQSSSSSDHDGQEIPDPPRDYAVDERFEWTDEEGVTHNCYWAADNTLHYEWYDADGNWMDGTFDDASQEWSTVMVAAAADMEE